MLSVVNKGAGVCDGARGRHGPVMWGLGGHSKECGFKCDLISVLIRLPRLPSSRNGPHCEAG